MAGRLPTAPLKRTPRKDSRKTNEFQTKSTNYPSAGGWIKKRVAKRKKQGGLRRAWRGLEGEGFEGGLKGAWEGFQGSFRRAASMGLQGERASSGLEGGFRRVSGPWEGLERDSSLWSLQGLALVLPALTDCRWWFESLLVHSGVSSATRRKATGADHKKKWSLQGLEGGFKEAWEGLQGSFKGASTGASTGASRRLEKSFKGAWEGLEGGLKVKASKEAWRELEKGFKGASEELQGGSRRALMGLQGEGGFKRGLKEASEGFQELIN